MKKYKNKEWLKKKYYKEKLTLNEIAKVCNCHNRTISRYMDEHNLKRRSRINRYSKKFNHINLNKKLKENIEGLLLGDGCLYKRSKNGGTRYQHTDKNKKFMEWLRKYLENLGLKITGEEPYKHYYNKYDCNTYHIISKRYIELNKLYEEWFKNSKKKIPEDFELTPTKLFWWYVGDGSISKDNKDYYILTISAYNFNLKKFKENNKEKLKRNNINININSSGNRIYVRRNSHIDFFKYLSKSNIEIPPDYKYKFPYNISFD